MKTREEIIKEHIPNGIVNIKAVGRGNGKPQYQAEIDVIVKCMDEWATQQAEDRWIKVTDRLPTSNDSDEDDKVLGWDRLENKTHKCSVQDICEMKYRFSHWQPLPSSPKQ